MLLDSNIIIYCIRPENVFLQHYISFQSFVSCITKIEVLGYHHITPQQIKGFNLCFDNLNILEIDEHIVERAIALKQNKSMKLGDSLIAATALENGLSIITRNDADFKNIQGLRVINPFK